VTTPTTSTSPDSGYPVLSEATTSPARDPHHGAARWVHCDLHGLDVPVCDDGGPGLCEACHATARDRARAHLTTADARFRLLPSPRGTLWLARLDVPGMAVPIYGQGRTPWAARDRVRAWVADRGEQCGELRAAAERQDREALPSSPSP